MKCASTFNTRIKTIKLANTLRTPKNSNIFPLVLSLLGRKGSPSKFLLPRRPRKSCSRNRGCHFSRHFWQLLSHFFATKKERKTWTGALLLSQKVIRYLIFYYSTSPYLQLSNEDLFRKVEKKEEEALLNRLPKKVYRRRRIYLPWHFDCTTYERSVDYSLRSLFISPPRQRAFHVACFVYRFVRCAAQMREDSRPIPILMVIKKKNMKSQANERPLGNNNYVRT